ncbi:hypothetical protein Drorol1_Dr00001957 [Drosera rotundifolia]
MLGTDLSSARLQLDTNLSLAGLQLGGVVFREERSELGGTDFVEGRSEDVGDEERGCSLMRHRGPMMGEVNVAASGGRSSTKEATPWWIRRLQLGGVVFRKERSELGGIDFVEGRSKDVGDAERGCSLMRRRGLMMGEVNVPASGARSSAKEATPWWIRREEVGVIADLV